MIVLDTHAWIWFVDDRGQLSGPAQDAVQRTRAAGEVLHISCISTWEVHMLLAKQRLSLAMPGDVWVSRCEATGLLAFHPVNNDIARLSVVACAGLHGDPADQIIVATALYLGADLVTCDERIRAGGLVTCIW